MDIDALMEALKEINIEYSNRVQGLTILYKIMVIRKKVFDIDKQREQLNKGPNMEKHNQIHVDNTKSKLRCAIVSLKVGEIGNIFKIY